MGLLYILAYISVTDPWVGAETHEVIKKISGTTAKVAPLSWRVKKFYSGLSIQAIA
jgi:hypothetical protein